jgi:transposase
MQYVFGYDSYMGIASGEIRRRAIEAYEAGKGTQAEVARLYGVDISTFQRWLRRYREDGRAAPLPRGHNPPALDEGRMSQLDALVQQTPDATLEQLREGLAVHCSVVAIHNALKRLGYRYKKNAAGQRTRTRGCQTAPRGLGRRATRS